MTAYEPVPTADNQTPVPHTSTSNRSSKFSTLRKALLFTSAFCFTAFAVYKAGQWSAESSSSQVSQLLGNNTSTIQESDSVDGFTNTSVVEMPGSGKYSVG